MNLDATADAFATNETEEMPAVRVPPAIEVSSLSKRFGDVTAVDDVFFKVDPGELFFLLGPSGCGKTTLLRMLAGLETPDEGVINMGGRDVSQLAPHLRGAPMVFQNYALWPHMSVYDNIAFGLVEQGFGRAEIQTRVREALAQVDLEGYDTRRPGELSGGQQQRVVLARALVMRPAVVLLDEPLSNLDARLRAEMREEIQYLHEDTDITFVFVTHDQVEALSLADRMAVMNNGRLCSLGTPADLYHRPPNRFTAEFLGETNWVEGIAREIEDGLLRMETPFGMWSATCPAGHCPDPGTEVRCMVRPESIDLLRRTPMDSINYFDGNVTSCQMNGSTLSVTIRSGEQQLKASLLNRPEVDLPVGRGCAWGIRPEHTLLLGEDD